MDSNTKDSRTNDSDTKDKDINKLDGMDMALQLQQSTLTLTNPLSLVPFKQAGLGPQHLKNRIPGQRDMDVICKCVQRGVSF